MDRTEDIVRQWKEAASRHPVLRSDPEGDRIRSQWDRISADYTGSDYNSTRRAMTADLERMDVIHPDRDMIDIGCGPGIYDTELAGKLRSITCVDGSEGMLSRLRERCAETGTENIEIVHSLWEDFVTDRVYDIAFSSLCPAVYNPESLLRMEQLARNHCVYISGRTMSDTVDSMIWKGMGRDRSYGGITIEFPCRLLRSMGRGPMVRKYYRRSSTENDPEELKENRLRYFSEVFGASDRLSRIVSDSVDAFTVGGRTVQNTDTYYYMMVWRPG